MPHGDEQPAQARRWHECHEHDRRDPSPTAAIHHFVQQHRGDESRDRPAEMGLPTDAGKKAHPDAEGEPDPEAAEQVGGDAGLQAAAVQQHPRHHRRGQSPQRARGTDEHERKVTARVEGPHRHRQATSGEPRNEVDRKRPPPAPHVFDDRAHLREVHPVHDQVQERAVDEATGGEPPPLPGEEGAGVHGAEPHQHFAVAVEQERLHRVAEAGDDEDAGEVDDEVGEDECGCDDRRLFDIRLGLRHGGRDRRRSGLAEHRRFALRRQGVTLAQPADPIDDANQFRRA